MPKTSVFDAINQQLAALSLDELQLVRAKVDVLIVEKLSQAEQDNRETNQKSALLPMENLEILRALADEGQKSIELLEAIALQRLALRQLYTPELLKTFEKSQLFAKQLMRSWEEDRLLSLSDFKQILDEEKSPLEKDDSLEKIIELVDEWMSDESGYDETVLPEIKAGLDQNRLVEK
ncbi:hypothetical protein NUACC21_76220 [Scytonema sp. NUACC21]